MNDLYIETARPSLSDLEDRTTPVDCSDCGQPIDACADPAEVFVVGDMSGGVPLCAACTAKTMSGARAIGQNVHDRREDPEKLLEEIAALLASVNLSRLAGLDGDRLRAIAGRIRIR